MNVEITAQSQKIVDVNVQRITLDSSVKVRISVCMTLSTIYTNLIIAYVVYVLSS